MEEKTEDDISKIKEDLSSHKLKIENHEELIQQLFKELTEIKKRLSENEKKKNNNSINESGTKLTSPQLTTTSTNKKEEDKDNNFKDENKSIAEMAKETAEATLAKSNFVYDQNSGYYFDVASGLYYDHVRALHYNGHTRTYYTFDTEKQDYIFHSQIPDPEPEPASPSSNSKETKARNKKKKRIGGSSSKDVQVQVKKREIKKIKPPTVIDISKEDDDDIEEGELTSSCSSVIETDESDSTFVGDGDSNSESSKKDNPPCIRIIVLESPSLEKGFLFIVTCMGGTIGSDGSQHAVLIEDDPDISEFHAQINYEDGKYYLVDIGSEHGTILNGKRISEEYTRSEPEEIVHGSKMQVGQTSLLLHIHDGHGTCGQCEPGLLIKNQPLYGGALSKQEKEAIRKKEIRKLRRKYGLEKDESSTLTKLPKEYKNRSEVRRKIKGSDNPFEKTEIASIETNIRSDNKGFKMLEKMGWKVGDSLGSSQEGITEPIKLQLKSDRGGLGSDVSFLPPSAFNNNKIPSSSSSSFKMNRSKKSTNPTSKVEMMAKTYQRFEKCKITADAFEAEETEVNDDEVMFVGEEKAKVSPLEPNE